MSKYVFTVTIVIWILCDVALMTNGNVIGVAAPIAVMFTAFLFIPLLGWQLDALPRRHLRSHGEIQTRTVFVQMPMSTSEPLLQPIPEPTEPDVKEETSEELRIKAFIESWKVRH